MTLEEELRKFIETKYKSISEFANECGLHKNTVLNIFNRGITSLGCMNLYKIISTLNIDFYSLMRGRIEERTYTGYRLTNKEENLIEKYRALDDFGVNAVDNILSIEKDRNIYYDNKIRYIYKPLTYQSAAAGLGDIIDPYADAETVKIARTPESEASDFIIILTGNSMEPTFYDHDYLLIHSQPSVRVGDIGLFVYQNDAYIKELGINGLVSHNKEYDLIQIHDPESFTTIGKVLGKTEIIKE